MGKLKKIIKQTALALGISAALAGCDSWESNLEKKIRDRGFTSEQAEVGAAEGLKRVFTDKTENEDGTVTYKLNYDVIKDSEVLSVVEDMYQDVKEMLDYGRNNVAWLKYLKNTGRGKHLKKQEKIYKYYQDVLREKKLHRKFKKLVGENGFNFNFNDYNYGRGYNRRYQSYSPIDQFKIKDKERYSLVDVFPLRREKKEFDTSDVKKARKRGDFTNPKKKVEEILTRYEFMEKVENPQYIVDYGEKKWIFKQRIAGLKIVAYNLDNDKEKKADYIEVYRFRKTGMPESKPAVRIFTPSGSDDLEVVVADADFEGEGGYGMPDYVGRHYPIKTARDLMENSQLLDFIFRKKKDEEKREWPEIKEMNKTYIVKTGTLPMNPYTCNGCWNDFLPEYKTDPQGRPNRYTTHIRRDIDDGVEEEDKHIKKFPIKWIALEYGNGARVVEFYKVKENFKDKKVKVNVFGNRISIENEKGQIKDYNVNAVIEDKPYRIDFDRNSQKRWEILDKDEDSKCYECKRERARTKDIIPKR